ncbi:MAG: hypothetical protein AB8G26_10135 [Ilumatobacter sp.]
MSSSEPPPPPPAPPPGHDVPLPATLDEPETPSGRRKRRVELAGAIIIGVAAVLTSIATLQGSRVDGDVQRNSTAALGYTLQANDLYNESTAEEAEERDWFFGYLTAAANGQNDTADVLFQAMPAQIQALTAEWLLVNQERLLDPNEPIDDPFFVDADGNATLNSQADLPSTLFFFDAVELDELAECALFDSRVAEIRGDNYSLSGVFLAIALVVGGIAALLKGKAAQVIVLATSVLTLALGSLVLVLAGDEVEARTDAAVDFFRTDEGTPQAPDAALAQADSTCSEGTL